MADAKIVVSLLFMHLYMSDFEFVRVCGLSSPGWHLCGRKPKNFPLLWVWRNRQACVSREGTPEPLSHQFGHIKIRSEKDREVFLDSPFL